MDAFALLGEPRRPWIDVDSLKSRFRALCADKHPDRFHNAPPAEREVINSRYAELNEAFNLLQDPRARLQHLLELELGGRPKDIQRIPPGTMDLFVEVGQTCRDCDEYLTRKASATSPMLKLRVMQEGLDWLEKLQKLQGQIQRKNQELQTELIALNAIWEGAPEVGSDLRPKTLPLERLEQLYRAMSYVSRWTDQLQERLVQLAE
jgi:curved DNA-binding protein CbpA